MLAESAQKFNLISLMTTIMVVFLDFMNYNSQQFTFVLNFRGNFHGNSTETIQGNFFYGFRSGISFFAWPGF